MSEGERFLGRFGLPDRVLVAGAGLLFLDSLLPWQRRCAEVGGVAVGCRQANAWGANGAVLGVVMAILALALAWLIVIERTTERPPSWLGSARPVLIAGTLVAGLLKLVFVLGHFPAVGAWIGLVLLAAVTVGGILWTREPEASSG